MIRSYIVAGVRVAVFRRVGDCKRELPLHLPVGHAGVEGMGGGLLTERELPLPLQQGNRSQKGPIERGNSEAPIEQLSVEE